MDKHAGLSDLRQCASQVDRAGLSAVAQGPPRSSVPLGNKIHRWRNKKTVRHGLFWNPGTSEGKHLTTTTFRNPRSAFPGHGSEPTFLSRSPFLSFRPGPAEGGNPS